jgi:hypothetical protein
MQIPVGESVVLPSVTAQRRQNQGTKAPSLAAATKALKQKNYALALERLDSCVAQVNSQFEHLDLRTLAITFYDIVRLYFSINQESRGLYDTSKKIIAVADELTGKLSQDRTNINGVNRLQAVIALACSTSLSYLGHPMMSIFPTVRKLWARNERKLSLALLVDAAEWYGTRGRIDNQRLCLGATEELCWQSSISKDLETRVKNQPIESFKSLTGVPPLRNQLAAAPRKSIQC